MSMATFEDKSPLSAWERGRGEGPMLVTQPPLIDVRGLTKRYGRRVTAVDHVDLVAYPGEVLGNISASTRAAFSGSVPA